ncbi:hypothetical protein Clacol_005130 [Clathrus columnatus]|uniref:Uncharacterized protein n=1 Tax=Clathrus columnatus TaxID=1419009 RepID=A0AAV5ABE6_9AGAM|nr:hypothetical protein Clacol_005130 [Clathrus columnatus]
MTDAPPIFGKLGNEPKVGNRDASPLGPLLQATVKIGVNKSKGIVKAVTPLAPCGIIEA